MDSQLSSDAYRAGMVSSFLFSSVDIYVPEKVKNFSAVGGQCHHRKAVISIIRVVVVIIVIK